MKMNGKNKKSAKSPIFPFFILQHIVAIRF